MVKNSPRIHLDLTKDVCNVDNYTIDSIYGDHKCSSKGTEMDYQSCLSFTKDFVLMTADLECTVEHIYSKMFDYGLAKLGSDFIISNWPNPSIVKSYIKRARQNLREPLAEILPEGENSPHVRSKYVFSDKLKEFENRQILYTNEDNSQIFFCHPDCLKYLTLEFNCRIQCDGTMWNLCKNVYAQVFIIIATTKIGEKYLDVPV